MIHFLYYFLWSQKEKIKKQAESNDHHIAIKIWEYKFRTVGVFYHSWVLTTFQLVSLLALTVQLKFLFLLLLVFKKFFKLVSHLSWVYVFTQTHPHKLLFAGWKSIVLYYMDWNNTLSLCTEQQRRWLLDTCSSSVVFLCFSVWIWRS